MTQSHTPTPWKGDPEGLYEYIWGPQNEMVAMIRGVGQNLPREANRDFILLAVNSHDALLEACQEAWVMLKEITGKHSGFPLLESAIARATGGKE